MYCSGVPLAHDEEDHTFVNPDSCAGGLTRQMFPRPNRTARRLLGPANDTSVPPAICEKSHPSTVNPFSGEVRFVVEPNEIPATGAASDSPSWKRKRWI